MEKPAEQKKGMAIAMKYYYPDYFDDFECVPGHECPDSCCIRWQIVVDPDTLKKYRHVQGPAGKSMIFQQDVFVRMERIIVVNF